MSNQTFENAMKQLEQIVQELESSDQPLETAIAKFEEGIKLSKYCSQKLDETEKRISILLKDKEGNISAEPFPSDNISE